jgi:subtilase family serine protease
MIIVDGTSCSAPIVAGMITLFNSVRLKAGKSPMGFINPFLYSAYNSNPNTFFDVTQGNNADGINTSYYFYLNEFRTECCPGFNAYKGWDPVTGNSIND